jgi:hypothetical protein
MPEIVGKFRSVSTSTSPIDAYVSHLRYLSNAEATRRTLQERFTLRTRQLKDISLLVSAHVAQALEFHTQSLTAPRRVRPVLQYYCYLNLAVATILAYRPMNYQQYRRHGVEDLSHKLNNLNMNSILMQAKHGAIPLFHSLLSDESIYERKFRLNELLSAIPPVSDELIHIFGAKYQIVIVTENVNYGDQGHWWSHVQLECLNIDKSPGRLTRERVERSMPGLVRHYTLQAPTKNALNYKSKQSWASESEARDWHRQICMKFINFGGHHIYVGPPFQFELRCQYQWEVVLRKPLFPTLTAVLLLSFGLASISRYRPMLSKRAENSALNLLFDVFIQESDSIIIPAMRNLLFREELCVTQMEAI